MTRQHPALGRLGAVCAIGVLLASCGGPMTAVTKTDAPRTDTQSGPPAEDGPRSAVTLAFAGDMHFQMHLAALLDQPRGGLGPITGALKEADLTMVNLETAITQRGTPDPKELEVPGSRYHFRTPPAALDLLGDAGVDLVSLANNHGADYGHVGLVDTLRAIRHSPIPVLGVGRNRRAVFTPFRVSVRGTGFAFFAADASFREGASSVWAAGPETPGIASARSARPRVLLDAVRAASERDEVVVVYLHWGAELQSCPTRKQRITARALAQAGADVIVGSHAHVLLGSGWLSDTYVNYGLGNFLWYHNHQPETGELQLRIRDGEVVGDSWIPALIETYGRPLPLSGRTRAAAVADWRRLRSCADLAPRPPSLDSQSGARPGNHAGSHTGAPTPYTATVPRICPGLRALMRFSHGLGCPVPWQDLSYLRMTYIGFDGRAHTGEMVVHRDYAEAVTQVFEQLYEARWPIQRMQLVDAYRVTTTGRWRLTTPPGSTAAVSPERMNGQLTRTAKLSTSTRCKTLT